MWNNNIIITVELLRHVIYSIILFLLLKLISFSVHYYIFGRHVMKE